MSFVFGYRLYASRSTVLPISEALLFGSAFVAISTVMCVGVLFQFYLSQLINWNGYNVHDLLLGASDTRIDDLELVKEAIPLTVWWSAPVLLFSHFQTKPFRFLVVSALGFFLTITISDVVITLIFGTKKVSPIAQDVLSNAIGSPFLGILATSIYFFLARVVTGLDSKVARPVSIVALTAIIVLLLTATLLGFQKIFLVPATTYFEAKISSPNTLGMDLSPPRSDATANSTFSSGFDVIGTPHKIGEFLRGDFIDPTTVSIKSHPNGGVVLVRLLSVSGCSWAQFESFISHASGKNKVSDPVRALSISLGEGFTQLYVPSPKSKPIILSASRRVKPFESYYTTLSFKEGLSAPSISDLLMGQVTFFVQPTDDYFVAGISNTDVKTKTSHVKRRPTLTIDNKAYRLLFRHSNSENSKCIGRPVTLPPMNNTSQGILIVDHLVIIAKRNATDPNGGFVDDSRPQITAESGFFSTGPISASNPFDDNEAPLATGDLSLFSTIGKMTSVRLYGRPVDLDYEGWLLVEGDRFSATLERAGTVKLQGQIQSIHTKGERLMKTPWELMDSGLQIFFLSSLIAVGVYLARIFLLFISRNDDAVWQRWTF